MEKDLSIIIQSFERSDLLDQNLKLLHERMLPHLKNTTFEIIIADDGSTNEEIFEVVEKYGYDEFFTNKGKEKGPGYTLNQAHLLSCGKFTMHLEDDFWLVNQFDDNDFQRCIAAFEKISNLGLIRLRKLHGENSEERRLNEYVTKTLPERHTFNGKEFAVFKSFWDGGPTYQYTGNSHIRKRCVLEDLQMYPEDKCIWGLENAMADRFIKSKYHSGLFYKGWFTHKSDKTSSTKLIKGVYKK